MSILFEPGYQIACKNEASEDLNSIHHENLRNKPYLGNKNQYKTLKIAIVIKKLYEMLIIHQSKRQYIKVVFVKKSMTT